MNLRRLSFLYFLALLGAASLNYLPIPGLVDAEGRTFGIFALDAYDDGLHLVSALWALASALISKQAARLFLLLFGALYLADGALGVVTGSGYLDLGIFFWGWLDQPLWLNILSSLPHVILGGVALAGGLTLDRK